MARKANESLGGVYEVIAFGADARARLVRGLGRAPGRPPGPGDHVDPGHEGRGDRRRLRPGRSGRAPQAHDEIFHTEERGFHRETNRAGGLEGGMTTGDPLVVRGAMKPLPTLTKPLRSVDLQTQEPAQALRERTDSCTVPAAAVVAEAMVALVLAPTPTGRSSAATTSTTPGGAARLRGAHRMEALTGEQRMPASPAWAAGRWCSSGFMGAGKSAAPRGRWPPSCACSRWTPTASSRPSWARRSSRSSTARASRRSASARRPRCCGCSTAPRRWRGGAGRRCAGVRAVRDALRRHTVVHLEVEPDEAWRRAAGKGRPLARDRGRFDQLHADRRALYESVAHAVLPPAGRDVAGAPCRALVALRDGRAAGLRGCACCGRDRLRGTTRSSSAAALIAAASIHPEDGRRFVVTDANVAGTTGSRPSTR